MRLCMHGVSGTCLKVLSAHGATDVLSPRRLLPYAIVALPCNARTNSLVSACFCVSTVVHFAQDVGGLCSSVLILLALAAISRVRYTVALRLITAFMLVVHVPLHYVATYRQHGPRSICIGLAATLVMPRIRQLKERHQLIVISHVLSNL